MTGTPMTPHVVERSSWMHVRWLVNSALMRRYRLMLAPPSQPPTTCR